MSTQTDPRSTLATRSWFAVVLAYQSCERQYGRMLAEFDLTIAQYDVLSAIAEAQPDATPAVIAKRLLVTKGNITGLLKRLNDQGWTRMQANPKDGRSMLCQLSPEAAERLAAAQQASAAFIAAQLAPFTDLQLRDIESQMTRMRLHLEQLDTQALAKPALDSVISAKIGS